MSTPNRPRPPKQPKGKPKVPKGPRFRFSEILGMEVKDIKERFPKGADNAPGSHWWTPAETAKATDGILYYRSLKDILSEKRLEPDSMLHRDASKNYTETTFMALGAATGKTADRLGRPQEPEPASPPDSVVRALTVEAHGKDAERLQDRQIEGQARVIANKAARLLREGQKYGIDYAPVFHEMFREANAELAAKRKAA